MASRCLLRLVLLLIAGLITKVHAQKSEKLVGGLFAEAEEFPYQVYLKVSNEFSCGGALITSQHVLTAAHCVTHVSEPIRNLVVVTGSLMLDEGEVHSVKTIYSHPQFVHSTSSSFRHDIAVIVLQQRIKTTPFQKPIRIATGQTFPGAQAVISGWGRTQYRDPVSQHLLKVQVEVETEQECQKKHRLRIYPSHICTRNGKGNGFCDGDSGGPLVHNNEVIGIVSWSRGCAFGYPDVYTNVYYYRSFINEILHLGQT